MSAGAFQRYWESAPATRHGTAPRARDKEKKERVRTNVNGLAPESAKSRRDLDIDRKLHTALPTGRER